MTLMPVSRISVVGFCWENAGGSRWIDHFSCASTVPFSSMACPSTLNIRPSVASPTGASMVRPVDSTSSPRPIPSLGESIMQRTVSPPICCATSIMRTCPSGATDRASLISGRLPPSKATSTTGPVTCTTVPLRFIVFSSLSMRGCRPPENGRFASESNGAAAASLSRCPACRRRSR